MMSLPCRVAETIPDHAVPDTADNLGYTLPNNSDTTGCSICQYHLPIPIVWSQLPDGAWVSEMLPTGLSGKLSESPSEFSRMAPPFHMAVPREDLGTAHRRTRLRILSNPQPDYLQVKELFPRYPRALCLLSSISSNSFHIDSRISLKPGTKIWRFSTMFFLKLSIIPCLHV